MSAQKLLEVIGATALDDDSLATIADAVGALLAGNIDPASKVLRGMSDAELYAAAVHAWNFDLAIKHEIIRRRRSEQEGDDRG